MNGRLPIVTLLLIAANLFAAAFTLYDPGAIERWGFVPQPLAAPHLWERGLTILTSMFVHLDATHLLANMLILAALGPAVEKAAGGLRFATVYLAAGFAGALVHWGVVSWAQPLIATHPLAGASAAIAGLIGYSWLRFHRRRVLLLPSVYVPAWILVVVWVVLQIAGGMMAVAQFGAPVAYWAHLGGFATGFLLGAALSAGRDAATEVWTERISEAHERGPASQVSAAEEFLRRKPNDPASLRSLFEGNVSLGHFDEAEDALVRLLRAEPAFDHAFPAIEIVGRGWASGLPQVERLKIAERIEKENPAAAEGLLRTILEEPETAETPYALLALLEIAAEEDAIGARHYASRLLRSYALSPQAEIALRRWPELFGDSG